MTEGAEDLGSLSESEPSESGAQVSPLTLRKMTLVATVKAKLRHPSRLVRARKANELRQEQATSGRSAESAAEVLPPENAEGSGAGAASHLTRI